MSVDDPELVIDYIQHRTKGKFPKQLLIDNPYTILAGGSVANAIISLAYGEDYPINDFDVFMKVRKNNFIFLPETIVTVSKEVDTQYPANLTSRLEIDSRIQLDDVDCIFVAVTDASHSNKEVTELEFYNIVLASFDLNCVGAGIYYDSSTQSFKVIYTEEFEEFFAVKNKVEIVNIHSQVTVLRLIKKTKELNAYCNLETELQIIGTACNPDNLKSLNYDQIAKHQELMLFKPVIDLALRAKRTDDLEIFYETFGELYDYNKRQLKIKVLRRYFDGTKIQRRNILTLMEYNSQLFIQFINHSGKGFIEDIQYSREDIKQIMFFLLSRPYFLPLFLGLDTFSDVIKRYALITPFQQELIFADVKENEFPVSDKKIKDLIGEGSIVYNSIDNDIKYIL